MQGMNPMGSNPPMPTGMGVPNQPAGPMNVMQQMIFNNLYNNNPDFRQLADSVMSKTPEQAFQEYGLDYNQFRNVNPEQVYNGLMGMNR